MNFFNKLSAAIVGELLFKMVFVLEMIIQFHITVSINFAQKLVQLRMPPMFAVVLGRIGSSVLSLFFTTALLFNPFFSLPLLVVLLVAETVSSLVFNKRENGVLTGWNIGFVGLYQHCVDRFNFLRSLCFRSSYIELPFIELPFIEPPVIQLPVFNLPSMNRNHLDAVVNQNNFLLRVLELSPEEFTLLCNNQLSPLTGDELNTLKTTSDAAVKLDVALYNDLMARLVIDGTCPILFAQPEPKTEAVLLVKLKQQEDGSERAVLSHLFDKQSLSGWFSRNNTHPVTRDDLIRSEDANRREPGVRYVVHPCYSSEDSAAIISQQLSDLIGTLRKHLVMLQKTPNERIREARLAFFLPSQAVASAATSEQRFVSQCD